MTVAPAPAPPPPSLTVPWWLRLTLQQQQALILGCGTGFGILTLVIGGSLLTGRILRSQLQHQAETELALIQSAYQHQSDQLAALSQVAVQHPDVSVTLRLEVPTPFLEGFLQEQIERFDLELGILVTPEGQIVNSIQRLGQTFAPTAALTTALRQGEPQQALTLLPWQTFVDAQSTLPNGFGNQEGLVQMVVTPVRDPDSQEVLGAWIIGSLINQKAQIPQGALNQLPRDPDGFVVILARSSNGAWQPVVTVGDTPPLDDWIPTLTAVPTWNGTLTLNGQTLVVATQTLPSADGDPLMLIGRGIPTTAQSWGDYTLGIGGLVVLILIGGGLVYGISRSQVEAITELQQAIARHRSPRLGRRDGLGALATAITALLERLHQQEGHLQRLRSQHLESLSGQQQQTQRLQEKVMDLILAMDAAQQGDLTRTAPVSEDELGSVADAFNALVTTWGHGIQHSSRLSQGLATATNQGQHTSQQLRASLGSQWLRMQSSLAPVTALQTTLSNLVDLSQRTLTSSQTMATAWAEEQALLNQTNQDLNGIRSTIADTAKQTKRLGESAQDISQLIGVILETSDRTNLLAFNAAIEAARAGEQGQGFRTVAEEVRRLAQQVGELGQQIALRIRDVQQQASAINVFVESSTSQVVSTTQSLVQSQTLGARLGEDQQQVLTLLHTLQDWLQQAQSTTHSLTTAWGEISDQEHSHLQQAQALEETLTAMVQTLGELEQSLQHWQPRPSPVLTLSP